MMAVLAPYGDNNLRRKTNSKVHRIFKFCLRSKLNRLFLNFCYFCRQLVVFEILLIQKSYAYKKDLNSMLVCVGDKVTKRLCPLLLNRPEVRTFNGHNLLGILNM